MPDQQQIQTPAPAPQQPTLGGAARDPGSNGDRAAQLQNQSLDRMMQAGEKLGVGAKGAAVRELQQLLGLGAGGQTGEFGPTTQKAVLAFQQQSGIQQTGQVGPTTYRALRAQSGANGVLFGHQSSGALAETARNQGVGGSGAAASEKMAAEDRSRLMKYRQNFILVAQRYRLPPALLAAIASRETRGGLQLDSRGYSVWDGYGFGLMQVDREFHTPKGGPGDIDHISQAAGILADFRDQAKARFPSWSPSRQLQIAVAAYNRGPSVFDHPSTYDRYTTDHDYSNDIWARARALARDFGGEGLPAESGAQGGAQGGAQTAPAQGGAQTAPAQGGAQAAPAPAAAAGALALEAGIRRGALYFSGDSGPEVLEIQRRLGITGSGLTGSYDPATEARVRAFQERHGLEADGIVGPETWAALRGSASGAPQTQQAPAPPAPAPPAPGSAAGPAADPRPLAEAIKAGRVFGEGDSGPAVVEIQTLLGLSAGGRTGTYGPTTAEAVKAFQARNSIQPNGKVGPDTFKALSRPAPKTPLIDQHRMDHERAGAFCGIATLMMTLQSNRGSTNGRKDDPQSRSGLEAFSRGIYTPGNGSSGDGMARRMRDHGLSSAAFTTGGTTTRLNALLAEGKTVPMGVVSLSGVVVEMKRPSARYPGLRVGDHHSHRFGASGHWVAVSGLEGDPRKPSHYFVNDPDTGAKLKMTPAELKTSADAQSGVWMISY